MRSSAVGPGPDEQTEIEHEVEEENEDETLNARAAFRRSAPRGPSGSGGTPLPFLLE